MPSRIPWGLSLQDGAFLKEVPSIAACHGLSVSLCTRCYSFGDARLTGFLTTNKTWQAAVSLKVWVPQNEIMLFMDLLYNMYYI